MTAPAKEANLRKAYPWMKKAEAQTIVAHPRSYWHKDHFKQLFMLGNAVNPLFAKVMRVLANLHALDLRQCLTYCKGNTVAFATTLSDELRE
jgi:hypothetical protein